MSRRVFYVWLLWGLVWCSSPSASLADPGDSGNKAEEQHLQEGEQTQRGNRQVDSAKYELLAHQRNYVLPYSYNFSPNKEPFAQDDFSVAHTELKFQLSIKSKLFEEIAWGDGDLWFGYTNLSFWQAYDTDNSSPFRETNHEPELFLDLHPNISAGSWRFDLLRLGLVHQSNGRRGTRSRSWDRLYALLSLSNDLVTVYLKPWYRIPESEKDTLLDPGGDDNPDIHKYLGYGELGLSVAIESHSLTLKVRNNLREHGRGAVQLDWSFPLAKHVRTYLQYFNGYGESLLDYKDSINRVGVGITFSDPFERTVF